MTTTSRLVHTTTTDRRADVEALAYRLRVAAMLDAETTDQPAPTYGACTACGAVETALNHPTGTRNLSHIGESATYPTGYGCELCD